jgi:hypothetical protein
MLLPQLYITFKGFRPAEFFFGSSDNEGIVPPEMARDHEDAVPPDFEEKDASVTTSTVLKEELLRMTVKHITFCRLLRSSGFLEKVTTSTMQLNQILEEFGKFLNLGYCWNGDNFHPSMVIDFVWHAALLNPSSYTALTTAFVGKQLPHSLAHNETPDVDQKRNAVFLRQFAYRHHRQPMASQDLLTGNDTAVFEMLEKHYISLAHEEEKERERARKETCKREEENRKREEEARKRQEEEWAAYQKLLAQEKEKEKSEIARLMRDEGYSEAGAYAQLHPSRDSCSC